MCELTLKRFREAGGEGLYFCPDQRESGGQVHGNVTETAAPATTVDEGTKVDRPTEA